MDNVLTYLENCGSVSFEDMPFNEVDAAILARLCFIPFDEAVPQAYEKLVGLGEALEEAAAIPHLQERMYYTWDYELLQKARGRRRLGELKVSGFMNFIDEEKETQFSAILYHLPDGRIYLVFRGTDDTLVGWKENFNMVITFPVPAQTMGLAYFNEAAEAFPDKPFILGGHSKGGNIAVFAGAFCDEKVRGQIQKIYNFDGPGFGSETLRTEGYQAVLPKISTYVPQSSVIGMLLEQEGGYTVIHSGSVGLMQHNILSWEVEGRRFKKLEKITAGSKLMDSTFKTWLKEMTPEQREIFVEVIFSVVEKTGASTLGELRENKLDAFTAVLKNIRNIDDDTKEIMKKTFALLFESAGEAVRLLWKA